MISVTIRAKKNNSLNNMESGKRLHIPPREWPDEQKEKAPTAFLNRRVELAIERSRFMD